MALPRKLKNMNLFNDGVSFVGVATEVVLPTLTRKLEEYRGAGMNGPVDADLGMEKLTVEHTYGGIVRELFMQFGITRADGVLLRFAGAYQRDDTGEVDAVEIVVRGRHEEIDMGKGKPGDDTEFKFKTAISYYKLSMNGAVLVEIDVQNMVCIVNGVDRLAELRAAIGA